jgi:tetratricopeptide (TPR) repeat protein
LKIYIFVVTKDPRDADALHILVITEDAAGRLRRGDFEGLLSMAKTCVAVQPKVPEFHLTLGQLYAVKGDWENAVECYDRALEIERNPEVIMNKGVTMLANQRECDAIKAFREYVQASETDEPNVPLACYSVALACLKYGDRKKTEEFWKKGVEFEKRSVKLPCSGPLDRNLRSTKTTLQFFMGMEPAAGLTGPNFGDGAINDDDLSKCGACGKTATALSKCARCKTTRYCGPACQKDHWPIHKKSCEKI